MKRTTLADVAMETGLTKSAVAMALKDQPGVSDETRQRVKAAADQLGWRPNTAATALATGRGGAVGLVIDRPPTTLQVEPYFMQLILGMQLTLSKDFIPLLFTLVEDQAEEIALYEQWWAEGRVDGTFLVDLKEQDPRINVLQRLHIPTIVIGVPPGSAPMPSVWSDEEGAMRILLQRISQLGHRRVARVAGLPELVHTGLRDIAFEKLSNELDLDSRIIHSDYSEKNGATATEHLLTDDQAPTCIIYDNDVMAVAGLTVAHQMKVRVPDDISIVSWDDSPLCILVSPKIAALHRDTAGAGMRAAADLTTLLQGKTVSPTPMPTSLLIERGTIGRPKTR